MKPRLRGVSHKWACIISVPFGVVMVIAAASTRARVAVAVYALSLVALFGVSALYHRIDWRSVAARRWMRRLDHSMIFVLIAGTYTPFALLVLHGRIGTVILITVWAGALGGVLLNLVWTRAPRWLAVTVYIALGWVAVAALPQLAIGLGVSGLSLLVLGGLLYSAGGVIYAIKRPDPVPTVFGYHEVFHVLVIAAAALQYAVIAFWVVPG
ncbi:MAG TPA: hemolysin III family protein [Solirubrobacteraceae bacterium]|nr:hemolysin III family protein [Solirubrobacteraceae bacterium]